jgi:hypothetical protein
MHSIAGKTVEVRTCVIPETRMNFLKSLAMNGGPLSETIPYYPDIGTYHAESP